MRLCRLPTSLFMLRRGRGRLRQCRPPWVTEVLRAIKPRRLIRRGVDRERDGATQQETGYDFPLPGLYHGLIGVCNPFVHVVLALWCPASHQAAGRRHVEPATGFCPLVAPPLATVGDSLSKSRSGMYPFYATLANLSIRLQYGLQNPSPQRQLGGLREIAGLQRSSPLGRVLR